MAAITSVVFANRWIVPARLYAEMTRSGERCESMWSGPAWASSSSTNTTVSFQYGDFDSASTMRPRARSLSAMQARGVGRPGRPPAV